MADRVSSSVDKPKSSGPISYLSQREAVEIHDMLQRTLGFSPDQIMVLFLSFIYLPMLCRYLIGLKNFSYLTPPLESRACGIRPHLRWGKTALFDLFQGSNTATFSGFYTIERFNNQCILKS